MRLCKKNGFTLAELLIALAILGVIATFTIPKILDSGTSSQWNTSAKEAIGMISGAFQNYKMNNTVTASTSAPDLYPFMNIVRAYSGEQIDQAPGNTFYNCNAGAGNPLPCKRLHSGGTLFILDAVMTFNDTASTSAIRFVYDPVPGYSGSATSEDKSLYIYLYANGRITTWSTVVPGTYAGTNPQAAGTDPSWFSWSNSS